MFKKFQFVAQIVGYATIALLAVYGLVTFLGGSPVLASALNKITAADPVIPATFNYQGLLRNPDGSLTTGTYTLTAKVYDAATAGLVLYTETFPNVTVRDGLFNIVLGDDPQGQDLQAALSAAPRYIGLTLVGQGDELIPRQRLHGVPWALYATNASQANDFTVSNNLTATTATIGGATIGTATLGSATIGTAVVNTATIGTAIVSGNISTTGNISWNRATGHLTGLALSGDYEISSDQSGRQTVPMVSSSNSMCFLTYVWFEDTEDDSEDARCYITDEGGTWILSAEADGTGFFDPFAFCRARCLQW